MMLRSKQQKTQPNQEASNRVHVPHPGHTPAPREHRAGVPESPGTEWPRLIVRPCPCWQRSGDSTSISGSGEVGGERAFLGEPVGALFSIQSFFPSPLLPRQCGAQQHRAGPGPSREALWTRLTFVASCARAGLASLGVQVAFILGAHWAPSPLCRDLSIPPPSCPAVLPMPPAWWGSCLTAAQGWLQQKGLTWLQDSGATQGRTKKPWPARSRYSHHRAWPGGPWGWGHDAPGRSFYLPHSLPSEWRKHLALSLARSILTGPAWPPQPRAVASTLVSASQTPDCSQQPPCPALDADPAADAPSIGLLGARAKSCSNFSLFL